MIIASAPPPVLSISGNGPARAGGITISCGTGSVSINTETGQVTVTDCSLDDAARAFWRAVASIGPYPCFEGKKP